MDDADAMAPDTSFNAPTSAIVRIWQCASKGANHQWRKIRPGELSVNPEADEQLGRVTG
jgi:hypothetical protein